MQKMKYLSLIFLIFPVLAFAGYHSEKKMVETIEKAQKNVTSKLSFTNSCPPETQLTTNQDRLLETCQNLVCGDFTSQNNLAMFYQAQSARKSRKEERTDLSFQKKILPRLDQIMSKTLSLEQQALESIEKILSQPQKVESNVFANLAFFRNHLGQIPLLPMTDPHKPVHFDLALAEGNFSTWPLKKRQFLFQLVQEYTDLDEVQDGYSYTFLGDEKYFKLKSPHLTLKEAMKIDAEKQNKLISEIQKSPYGKHLFISPESLAILKKAAQGNDLSPSDRMTYGMVRQKLSFDAPFLLKQSSLKYFLETPQESGTFTLQDELVEAKKRLSEKAALQERKRITLQLCQSGYFLGLREAPSANLKKKWPEIEKETKKQLSDSILPRFSTQTQEMLKSTLNSVRLDLPADKEEFLANYQLSLAAFENYTGFSEDILKSATAEQLLHIVRHIGTYAGVNNLCTQFSPKGVTDNALSLSGAIGVSPISVNFPQFGKATLLHEFGHILSTALQTSAASQESSQKFHAIRSCLDQKHQNEDSFQPRRFMEEDWADLISAVSSPAEGINPYCFGQNPLFPGSLKQESQMGAHSSFLFRLLHFHHVKFGSLPRVCNQSIKRQGVSYDFSSCMR